MNREQIQHLIHQYNSGLATAEQKALLDNWYKQKSESLRLEDGEIDFDALDSELRPRTFKQAGITQKSIPPRPSIQPAAPYH